MSRPTRAPLRPSGPPRPNRTPRAGTPWLVRAIRFTERHGWRAYALPVLIVVSIVGIGTSLSDRHRTSTTAVVRAPTISRSAPASSPSAAPIGPSTQQVKVDVGGQTEDLPADALPPGPDYTMRGDGTFRVLAGTTPVVGSGGPVRKYVIEVENGVTGIDLSAYAALIDTTLDAPKGWTGGNHNLSLQRVPTEAQADFRIALTSSLTLRPPCGHSLNIETSCWDDQHGPSRVYLNVARWVRGDAQFGQDLSDYRLYMINHEVGHALGHVHTYVCLPNGLAPVMMQETITLKEHQGVGPLICQPNVWPYPTGVNPKVAVPT